MCKGAIGGRRLKRRLVLFYEPFASANAESINQPVVIEDGKWDLSFSALSTPAFYKYYALLFLYTNSKRNGQHTQLARWTNIEFFVCVRVLDNSVRFTGIFCLDFPPARTDSCPFFLTVGILVICCSLVCGTQIP